MPLVQLDDVVEGVGDLAGDAGPVGRQADAGAALPEGGEGAEEGGHFGAVGGRLEKSGHGFSGESATGLGSGERGTRAADRADRDAFNGG